MSKTIDKSRNNKNFQATIQTLLRAGFKESKSTKTRIYTLTFSSANAKGYLSIRYHPEKDVSTVLAEFYGKTTTQEMGIGGGLTLIDITPRKQNHDEFPGLDTTACRKMFTDIGALMMQACVIYKAMEKF